VDTLEPDEAMNNPKDIYEEDTALDENYRMSEIVDTIGSATNEDYEETFQIKGHVHENYYSSFENAEIFNEESFYNLDKVSDCSSDGEDFDYLEAFPTFELENESQLMDIEMNHDFRILEQEIGFYPDFWYKTPFDIPYFLRSEISHKIGFWNLTSRGRKMALNEFIRRHDKQLR